MDYLTYVVDTRVEKDVLVSYVPVVREFPNMFSEDLPGELPKRQVEFMFDLVSNVAPIVKVLCRLAPLEMHKLTSQLQELLCNQFIRPNSLPWGAPIYFYEEEGWVSPHVY